MNGGDIPIPQQHRPQLPPQEYYQYPRSPPRQRQRDDHHLQEQAPFVSYDDPHENEHHSQDGQDSGDDSDETLSFQTLNADGTPKRPMNAFLLYAKKRRPQISTNHPTMRTGEISKVLSKEWQTMNKGEKQYYQDKAKKLKDTFNLRWPDYVYKRRPNNSRKKRRGNPSAESTVIEEAPSRRESEGAENTYGEESGAEEGEGGSPNLVVRLPHERHHDERLPLGYSSAPPAPSDPRSQPPQSHRPPNLPDSAAPVSARLGYSSSNPSAPYPPYDDSYASYPYYPPTQSTQSQSRLPPVWNAHDPSRSPYDGARSSSGTSAGYSPVTEEGQPWPAGGRPNASSAMNPSWQNMLQTSTTTGPMSSARALPRTTSADLSPIQSSAEGTYPRNRSRNWNAPAVPEAPSSRPQFQTLSAPLYPPSNSSHHGARGGSPPPYFGAAGGANAGNYGYSAPGSSAGAVNSIGRSPLLPAISSLEHPHASSHSYSQQPASSNLRDTGYSPSLPPISGAQTGTHSPADGTSRPYSTPPYAREEGEQQRSGQPAPHMHRPAPSASHPYSESRSSSSGSLGSGAPHHPLHRQSVPHLAHVQEADRQRGPDRGREAAAGAAGESIALPPPSGPPSSRGAPADFSNSSHHQSYWDPVKSEAGD